MTRGNSERKEKAKDVVVNGLGQASDQMLGRNNIGDRPFDRHSCEAFHMNGYIVQRAR